VCLVHSNKAEIFTSVLTITEVFGVDPKVKTIFRRP
jgi:hypothetical protein